MTQFTAKTFSQRATFVSAIRVEKVHQFTAALEGRAYFGGAVEWRIPVQSVRVLSGAGVFRGRVKVSKQTPFGAFRDFSHYLDNMADPAMVLIGPESSGQTTYDAAAPSNMRRVWVSVTPPREYPTTSEPQAWPRAAFASVGVRVNQMDTTTYQYVDGAQVEVSPLTQTGPTAYAPARSLNIKVRPDRLNWCANPKLDANTDGYYTPSGATRVAQGSGWAASAPGTALLSSAPAYGPVGAFWSVRATVVGPVGRTAAFRIHDGTAYTQNGWGVLKFTGEPQEIVMTSDLPAAGTEVRLYVYPDSGWQPGETHTMTRVLIERTSGPGVHPGPYFDGNDGPDYIWEAGKTAGNGASFYYRDRQARRYLLDRVLQENCPLGVIPAVPQFAVLPSE